MISGLGHHSYRLSGEAFARLELEWGRFGWAQHQVRLTQGTASVDARLEKVISDALPYQKSRAVDPALHAGLRDSKPSAYLILGETLDVLQEVGPPIVLGQLLDAVSDELRELTSMKRQTRIRVLTGEPVGRGKALLLPFRRGYPGIKRDSDSSVSLPEFHQGLILGDSVEPSVQRGVPPESIYGSECLEEGFLHRIFRVL